ncbi:MAG: glycosyl transferase [Hyphomicrobiales bacterium]|nr:glycosyl transferase [Hyphomicrobiales bacterium]
MALLIVLTLAGAATLSAGLVVALMPLLRRYGLARPNARSSHVTPTPQGAGLAVVLAAALATAIGLAFGGAAGEVMREAAMVLAASLILAATGAIDDLAPLGPVAKLVPQVLAVTLVVFFAAPADARIFPVLPLALERALAVLAGVWFVNLVNFMDGIDWITVAGCGVPLAALAILGGATLSQGVAAPVLAAALCGALIGFSPFNKPVARVFLGDVGSLPIGLILGYGLYRLALSGHLAAALILPLYYLWDSGTTLLRRLSRRETVWEAHRSHVYQRATDAGWSVGAVVGQIFALDVALGAIALISVWQDSILISALMLILAMVLVALSAARLVSGPSAMRETSA